MAESKENREFPISLDDTVLIGKEKVEGIFDRCTLNFRKVGEKNEQELESITFRRVSLQTETYDPGKTPILLPSYVEKAECSDKFIGVDKLNNQGEEYRLGDFATWKDKTFPTFYRRDPRRNSHFYPPKKTTKQELPIEEKPTQNFARELFNRPITENGSDTCIYRTALQLESEGISGFRVDYGDSQRALHSTRNLTCWIINPARKAAIICNLDASGQPSGHIYQESEVHSYLTINRDPHPAVLETERILSQH